MAKKATAPVRVFNTDKRIRLGIWGLGRGMSFFNTCKFLNIDVVAGCDFNAHMRDNFLKHCPGAYVTDNEDDFLSQDFDAVLLATYCLGHGPHALKCLQAGKHVLSEVTSFFSMAEGVQLVEAVEKSGLVYNLAENYPFTAANMWLANRWREGLFGELMYGEYEYVHECRTLCYTYIDGVPVIPGHAVHNWRSWFNYHYYCTHSLGPVMVITGTRPVAVETFPCRPRLAGYLKKGANGTAAPSLIQMNNGAVVRNLMGATANDAHNQRLWGTLGGSEMGHGGLRLRLGGAGHAPLLSVQPKWEGLGELAAQTGHGGGDFWTLYYFAREILTGEKGPFDVYGGADVTIPGIQAIRSATEGGKPMEVPDFRKKADRDRYRSDDWKQTRYDTAAGVFGGFVPPADEPAARFSTVMKDLISTSIFYRSYADWKKVADAITDKSQFVPIAEKLLSVYPTLKAAYTDARAIISKYPTSDAAQVMGEMLELGEEEKAMDPAFLPALKREVAALRRRHGITSQKYIGEYEASALLPVKMAVGKIAYPNKDVKFTAATYNGTHTYCDITDRYKGARSKDGLIYGRCHHAAKAAGKGVVRVGADGPFKVFLNKKEVFCNPRATNPVTGHIAEIPVTWKKGKNEIIVALRTNDGSAWGFVVAL